MDGGLGEEIFKGEVDEPVTRRTVGEKQASGATVFLGYEAEVIPLFAKIAHVR